MEIYGLLEEGSIQRLGDSDGGDQHTVMDYFNQCIIKYDEDIKMEPRKKNKHKLSATLIENEVAAATNKIETINLDADTSEDKGIFKQKYQNICFDSEASEDEGNVNFDSESSEDEGNVKAKTTS
jgi:hypothetical protein